MDTIYRSSLTIVADQMNVFAIRIFMPEHDHDLILFPGQTYKYYGVEASPEDFNIRARLGDTYWLEGAGSTWAWGRHAGTEHPPGQMKLPLTFD